MGKAREWCVAMVVVVVVISVGCGGAGGEADGGADGSAGMDAAVPACSDTPLTGSCAYGGYGTMCSVSCGFPETCSFDVVVGWTGGYCCGAGGGVGSESFFDCRCVGGHARCARFPGSAERTTPTTFCEFCDRIDAGGP